MTLNYEAAFNISEDITFKTSSLHTSCSNRWFHKTNKNPTKPTNQVWNPTVDVIDYIDLPCFTQETNKTKKKKTCKTVKLFFGIHSNFNKLTTSYFLSRFLSFFHLAVEGAAVLIVSGAVGSCVLVDAVTAAALIQFGIFVDFSVLLVFSICVCHCAVLLFLDVLFRQPLTLHVGLDPEVGEEDEEEGAVHPDEVNDGGELEVTAVHKVILSGVEGDQDKLGLLKWGGKTKQQKCLF